MLYGDRSDDYVKDEPFTLGMKIATRAMAAWWIAGTALFIGMLLYYAFD